MLINVYLQAVVQQLLFLLLSHKRNNKENEHVTQYCPFSSFSLSRRSGKASSASAEVQDSTLHLDWDTLQEVIARLAYPISQWCDRPSAAAAAAAEQVKRPATRSRPRS